MGRRLSHFATIWSTEIASVNEQSLSFNLEFAHRDEGDPSELAAIPQDQLHVWRSLIQSQLISGFSEDEGEQQTNSICAAVFYAADEQIMDNAGHTA